MTSSAVLEVEKKGIVSNSSLMSCKICIHSYVAPASCVGASLEERCFYVGDVVHLNMHLVHLGDHHPAIGIVHHAKLPSTMKEDHVTSVKTLQHSFTYLEVRVQHIMTRKLLRCYVHNTSSEEGNYW